MESAIAERAHLNDAVAEPGIALPEELMPVFKYLEDTRIFRFGSAQAV